MARQNTIEQKLARGGTLVFMSVFCLELVSCVGGHILQSKKIFYEEQDTDDFAHYLAERDPVLGWPTTDLDELIKAGAMDESGARPSPAFPDARLPPCISVYGDSFAMGAEVDDEHAWANVLARFESCRVNNYGMSGYGTDQAYLRFLRNEKETTSKVVVLTILAENIVRNVNQLRNLLVPSTRYGLKPRYILGPDGELKLVPLSTPTEQEMKKIIADPSVLPHEYFSPGGPSAVSRLEFPYTVSIFRALTSFRVQAALKHIPYHTPFFEPDHPAGGLGVTFGIAKLFRRDAEARHQAPLVVTIPLPNDLTFYREKHRWAYQPLIERLDQEKIPHLNIGERLLEKTGSGDPCKLYTKCAGGHLNEEGYRIFAEGVRDWLEKRGIMCGMGGSSSPSCPPTLTGRDRLTGELAAPIAAVRPGK
jgi:hypothetical protein